GSEGTAFLWGRRREPPALCLRGWEPAGTSEETSHTSSTARARGHRPSQITIYGTAKMPRCVPRGCPDGASASSPAESTLTLVVNSFRPPSINGGRCLCTGSNPVFLVC